MTESLLSAYDPGKKINPDKNFTDNDYLIFDSLTSRFSRLSDIIVQKIIRTIDIINIEDTGTMRDRLNRAEKNGLISSVDEFVEIRKLRNDITHEYIPEEMKNIYKQVMNYVEVLFDTVIRINHYCKEKYNL